MALLPSFFVLQSGGKYLSVTDASGLLKFNEQIWSPRAKFAAEPAADGSGLIHIRSCYNNKYLTTKQIESDSWIVASAKKTEDDKSNPSSCTLFEPHSGSTNDDDQTKTVCLRHVGTGVSATHHDAHHGVVLLSGSGSSSIGSSFIVRDSNSVVVLPSLVAFKSQDLNGNYLGSVSLYDNLIYQKFDSGLDVGNQRVAKELIPVANGNYRIKDVFSGDCWILRDNWIKAEVYSTDESTDSWFSFVRIQDNVFALRNVGNHNFCGAYTESDSVDCLCAIYPSMSKQTKLILEEPVIERKISDVVYRMPDSRIYNQQIEAVSTRYGSNYSTSENTMTLTFGMTESKTTSWNNSMSVKVGITVGFEVSAVPFIEKSDIEISAEFGYEHQWGESETKETHRETSYTVTVPPKKTLKVTMLATRGLCDVPFSYTQHDLLPSGVWVETKRDDGIFTGMNSYDIHFKSEEQVNP